MRKTLILAAAWCAIASRSAFPSTIHLRWNDCAAGPTSTQVMSFSCDDDTSTFRLVGSVVPDQTFNQFVGFQARVDLLASGGGPLSDWWQMQPGGCREAGIGVTPPVTGASPCPSLWSSSPTLLSFYRYPGTAAADYGAGLVVSAAANPPFPIVAGTEYRAFEIEIRSQHTTNADPPDCSGCDQNICIAFWYAELYYWQGLDEVTQGVHSTTSNVSWHCPTTAGVHIQDPPSNSSLYDGLQSCALGDCPTPARRTSWGKIKSLYR